MTARFPETSDRSVESELGSARAPSHAAGVKLEGATRVSRGRSEALRAILARSPAQSADQIKAESARQAALHNHLLDVRDPAERERLGRLPWAGPGALMAEALRLEAERETVTGKIDNLSGEIKRLNVMSDAGHEMLDWLARPLALQGVGNSFLHKITDRNIVGGVVTDDPPWTIAELATDCEVFLIQHDWASLVASVPTDDGEYRLPANKCCFEMAFTGRRVCALVLGDDGAPTHFRPFIQTSRGWIWGGEWQFESGRWQCAKNSEIDAVVALIAAQIRAVAITLDAEVTVSEVVRAPHRLNAARIKRHETPMFDHHILSLARRSRAAALPREGEPTRPVRLHFRRGHWRHYETHKTWIKWMLVGDPSLGFAAKDYAL